MACSRRSRLQRRGSGARAKAGADPDACLLTMRVSPSELSPQDGPPCGRRLPWRSSGTDSRATASGPARKIRGSGWCLGGNMTPNCASAVTAIRACRTAAPDLRSEQIRSAAAASLPGCAQWYRLEGHLIGPAVGEFHDRRTVGRERDQAAAERAIRAIGDHRHGAVRVAGVAVPIDEQGNPAVPVVPGTGPAAGRFETAAGNGGCGAKPGRSDRAP